MAFTPAASSVRAPRTIGPAASGSPHIKAGTDTSFTISYATGNAKEPACCTLPVTSRWRVFKTRIPIGKPATGAVVSPLACSVMDGTSWGRSSRLRTQPQHLSRFGRCRHFVSQCLDDHLGTLHQLAICRKHAATQVQVVF